jgi:hypothetical protein
MPPNAYGRSLDHTSPIGSQVNKFDTSDSDYRKNPVAVQFVDYFMKGAVALSADSHALRWILVPELANPVT